jgi:serine protease Do
VTRLGIVISSAVLFLILGTTGGFCQIYKYKDEKGNWCFSDNGTFAPPNAEIEVYEESEPVVDLGARMAESFPPRNAIEQARNATVCVVGAKGLGTGFFINDRGYVLTNRHVADDPDGVYKILFIDGTEFRIYGAELSDRYDIALLRLKSYKTPYIEKGDPRELAIGDALYAIGMPQELMHTVTSGIFSSFRDLLGVKWIQTNAQINAGNSGGPLVTQNGKVVGINTLKREDTEGLAFAIPINLAIEEFRRQLAR